MVFLELMWRTNVLSLATYGYAKQYSGVSLSSYVKHITSSNLTAEGLQNISGAVMQLAKVEELEAHRRAVSIRLREMDKMLSNPS
jgi:phosphoribosyl-ATP pyrophosphohydrolase / phosphoribosyl-AMP cyclohydrolase / histidinol dehydrogenase